MIRVLIVDDSRMIRDILTDILKEQPDIQVIGAAADAFEARDLIKSLKPDVITLDVEMPKMNGLEFLDRLMRANPMPVVMISSATERGSEVTFRALELGAVDFVTKPKLGEQTPDDYGAQIADKIRAAKSARLKVPRKANPEDTVTLPAPLVKRPVPRGVKTSNHLIAVGASTGGTEAIREFLVGMPADCPGIVIVQHMPENFTRMFAERLNGLCQINVKEAEHNDPILPGCAYIAPGGKHLWVKRDEGQLLAKLSTEAPMNLHRPSVDFLFLSCAKFLGADAIGVIMTGMGKDGAQGMLKMKEAGAWTIAQDEATSVIFGMPREAIEVGATQEVAPLGRLRDKALARAIRKERAMSATAEAMDVLHDGFGERVAEQARREFLTFRLGDETYGIDILQVQEIREIELVTRIPRVARFVRGVINLRGAIVPVVDLGLMFGFPEPIALEKASAIVLNTDRKLVGLVVSSVSDVIGLTDAEILPAPELGARAVGAAIAGIGARGGEGDASSVLLLDVEHLMQRIRVERA